MQILKEELREGIVAAAEYEFLKHGYKDTSMRSIAKRAHTTLGNVYNYFEGKEALFEALVGDLPKAIDQLIEEHEKEKIQHKAMGTLEDIAQVLDEADYKKIGEHIFLNKGFAILMEGAKGTKYEKYRQEFLQVMKAHLLTHVGEREGLANMLAHSFLEAILVVAKMQGTMEEAREELIRYLKIFIQGIMAFQK
ncbi:MAG: TetR/AcrR family transcriptional regulator [Cellulosilyticaceae bacterium]